MPNPTQIRRVILGSVGGFAGGNTGSGTGGTEATAFLARTSGLDSTHINAYIDLIDGLVADGVWSKLDVLYMFATQDSTTALLNLVSSGFTGISHGSPAFVADRGFTGVENSSTVYIDSQYNPITFGSPLFVQNSAHVSVWSNTAAASGPSGGVSIGHINGSSAVTSVQPRYVGDDKAYFRITDGLSGGVSNASGDGHYIANRTGSSTVLGYKNGSQIQSVAGTSSAPANLTFYVLAIHDQTLGAQTGAGIEHSAASIGAGLSGTDATNFYNRLRTYMTAVGVP